MGVSVMNRNEPQYERFHVSIKGAGAVDAFDSIVFSHLSYRKLISGSDSVSSYVWLFENQVQSTKDNVRRFKGLTLEITRGGANEQI